MKASIAFGTLLMASHAVPGAPPADSQINFRFETAKTVILVRAIDSTFPAVSNSPKVSPLARATVLVLKSWKGPFSPGVLLHVAPPSACFGSLAGCVPYLVQVGDELLIFGQETEDPIIATQYSVSRAADSKAVIATLDQAVKEQQELHDPETDVIRAPERQRILLALNECRAETLRHQGDWAFPWRCLPTDVSVLVGIKRSELVASLGPPTWCHRPSGDFSTAGTDCAPEETPLWSFEPTPSTPSGLMCQADETFRCVHIGWISVGH